MEVLTCIGFPTVDLTLPSGFVVMRVSRKWDGIVFFHCLCELGAPSGVYLVEIVLDFVYRFRLDESKYVIHLLLPLSGLDVLGGSRKGCLFTLLHK